MFDQEKYLMIMFILISSFITVIIAQNIVSVKPTQNQLNVDKDITISVSFDTDMNSATINESTYLIHASQTGLQTGTYNYQSGTRTATFNANKEFAVGEVVFIFAGWKPIKGLYKHGSYC